MYETAMTEQSDFVLTIPATFVNLLRLKAFH